MTGAIGKPTLPFLTAMPGETVPTGKTATSSRSGQANDHDHESAGSTTRLDTFETVFETEYPAVVRMAFLMLGRTGEAEEVAQEAFTTLLLRWGSVDNPAGFVRTAAVNRCRDIGRRRSVGRRALRRLRPVDDTEVGHTDGEPTDHMVVALQRLDLPLRELVVLRYYLDHTVPEISTITGTPEGTVKSRLHRALGQLQVLLGED